MPDIIDAATETAELFNRAALSCVRKPPPGEPGVCAACDEEMPRLVNGRCGYCRDGRPNPRSYQ